MAEPARCVAPSSVAGASAVLPKAAPTRHVVETVCRVASGDGTQTVREVAELLLSAAPEPRSPQVPRELERLSPRQRSLLPLLAEGLSNKEIAGRIGLSEGTVANYVAAVMARLGARSRAQLAALATQLALHGAPDRPMVTGPGRASAAGR